MFDFLFKKPNQNIMEWSFDYQPFSINITTRYPEATLSDNLLISGYILFLARYFYICDDRQVTIMKQHLLNLIKLEKASDTASELYLNIYQTLDESKKKAATELFKIYNPLFGQPPLKYSVDNKSSYSYAKYKFQVFKRKEIGLGNIFNMSAGPDIILLPITVCVLYGYILDIFQNILESKTSVKSFKKAISDLLIEYERVDCKSQEGFVNVPNLIIKNNNLFPS